MIIPKRVAIICSAPIADPEFVKEKISEYPILIAVDAGADHCLKLGLKPDLIVGDFDSISQETLLAFGSVPKKHYPTNKDETDLELALKLSIHPQTEEITVFGALGGRTDHIVGNLILLTRYAGKVFFQTESERLFIIKDHVEIPTKIGQIISLIPMNGPAHGITTHGLKWQLQDGSLDKNFIGISNQATGASVTISVQEGDLLCSIMEECQ